VNEALSRRVKVYVRPSAETSGMAAARPGRIVAEFGSYAMSESNSRWMIGPQFVS
jgi:hypothetical protein